MLLEKVYQPDISVYQEGVLGPMFMVEVVEDPRLAAEAEARFIAFLAHHLCHRGAIVHQGQMRILDIFPSSQRDAKVSVAAEVDLALELRNFSSRSGEVWSGERNFFDWFKNFVDNGAAKSLATADLDVLRREVLPWTRGFIVELTSLLGKAFGQAY